MLIFKRFQFYDRNHYPIAIRHMPRQASARTTAHGHDFSELVLVLDGATTHLLGDETANIEKGDVLLIHPGISHAYGDARHIELVNVIYDATIPLPLLESTGLPLISRLFPPSPEEALSSAQPLLRLPKKSLGEACRLADRLSEEIEELNPGKQALMVSLFTELIILLARCDFQCRNPREPQFAIGKVVGYLNEQYASRVTVEEMCRIASMSQRSLFRHFKASFGVTPNEYLLHIRVKQAMALLQNSGYSILRIARDCGFCDGNHLTKVFKKVTGITPGRFRQQDFEG